MKKVLIIWADPKSPNFGVRALAEGLADLLASEAEFTFAGHRAPLQAGSLSVKRLLLSFLAPMSAMRREIRTYDLVVDVGEGDSFATIYGNKRFLQMLLSKLVVLRARVPLVIAPQTLGPWETWWARLGALAVLRGSASAWARDSASLERAAAVGAAHVQLATDLVFAVGRKAPSRRDPRKALVNVSGLLWSENRHVDHKIYRQVVQRLIGDAVEAGFTPALLVHVNAPGNADDDLYAATEVAQYFGGLSIVVPDTLEDLREEIESAEIVVGSRMHACLNALSLGVPTVPLAYSDKFSRLFADLGYPHTIDLRQVQDIGLAGDVLKGDLHLLRQEAESAYATAVAKIKPFESALRMSL